MGVSFATAVDGVAAVLVSILYIFSMVGLQFLMIVLTSLVAEPVAKGLVFAGATVLAVTPVLAVTHVNAGLMGVFDSPDLAGLGLDADSLEPDIDRRVLP